MSTQPESTESTTTSATSKQDRKKKAIAFAKHIGEIFATNTAVGAGLGLGVAGMVTLVIKIATPKVVIVTQPIDGEDN